MHPVKALGTALEYIQKSSACLAHNSLGFDKPVLNNALIHYGFLPTETVWLDSRTDFEYPASTSMRLAHLAVDHGVYNHRPHKAIFDTITMFDIIAHYDANAAFEKAKSPLVTIHASPPYGKNEELKKNRYRWNPELKTWWKDIREIDFEKERLSVSFEIGRKDGKEKAP